MDSELIPTIISNEINKGVNFSNAIGKMFNEIYGMTNVALLSDYYDNLILGSNNGSIYYINDLNNGFFIFASERFILKEIIRKNKIDLSIDSIEQINPGWIVSVNLNILSF